MLTNWTLEFSLRGWECKAGQGARIFNWGLGKVAPLGSTLPLIDYVTCKGDFILLSAFAHEL